MCSSVAQDGQAVPVVVVRAWPWGINRSHNDFVILCWQAIIHLTPKLSVDELFTVCSHCCLGVDWQKHDCESAQQPLLPPPSLTHTQRAHWCPKDSRICDRTANLSIIRRLLYHQCHCLPSSCAFVLLSLCPLVFVGCCCALRVLSLSRHVPVCLQMMCVKEPIVVDCETCGLHFWQSGRIQAFPPWNVFEWICSVQVLRSQTWTQTQNMGRRVNRPRIWLSSVSTGPFQDHSSFYPNSFPRWATFTNSFLLLPIVIFLYTLYTTHFCVCCSSLCSSGFLLHDVMFGWCG